MNKILKTLSFLAIGASAISCSDSDKNDLKPIDPDNTQQSSINIARGADVSWLTEMEQEGVLFYYDNGTRGDCLDILKSTGINAVRFRIWVDPEGGWCSTEDVLKKARRAKLAGLDIMLDFHYSDSWADPGQQNIPKAWEDQAFSQLIVEIERYTESTLREFKQEGIDVKWVQIGNETGNGMLWPFGRADISGAGYAMLNNAAYDGVKKVYPGALCVIHLQNGDDNSLYTWLFDILKKYDGKWDVIGCSLYPDPDNWEKKLSDMKSNMEKMIARYDKDVMICEIGMGNSYSQICKKFIEGCIDLGESIPGGRMLGVFYWEPEVYNDWHGYKMGAFTAAGSPSTAMQGFLYRK